MSEIKLPPLPWGVGAEYDSEDMLQYARATVELNRATTVPEVQLTEDQEERYSKMLGNEKWHGWGKIRYPAGSENEYRKAGTDRLWACCKVRKDCS